MADDAIYRETKQSIDRLFAQVSGGAGSASKGLYDVASASKTASSGLGSLASGTGDATRAAGVFVTSVRQIETATSKYNTSLSASLAALNTEIGATINSATSRIDENIATIGASMGMAGRASALLAKHVKDIGPGLRSFYTDMKSGSLKIGKIMGKVADGGKALVGGWAKWLALGAVAIGTVEDYVDDSYKSWKLLTTAGIGLAGNLNNVGGMAGRTRLDFKDLSAALSRASPALAAFGGMADFGA
ncbi:MAG: hypothetical protein VX237_09895, partial [Chloroflexota bacterium]|nr:hypothetical protein [Chloroflexota bacterium]